jgi:hypothetical protein
MGFWPFFCMTRARQPRASATLLSAVVFAILPIGTCVADQKEGGGLHQYESYFGDEVNAASCDASCAEEWILKRQYICVLTMNDLNYGYIPLECEI